MMHRDRMLEDIIKHAGKCCECCVFDDVSGKDVITVLNTPSTYAQMDSVGRYTHVAIIDTGGSSTVTWDDRESDQCDIVVCEVTEPRADANHSPLGYNEESQVLVIATNEYGSQILAEVRHILEGGYDGWDEQWGAILNHPAKDSMELPADWIRLAGTQSEDGTSHFELKRFLSLIEDHSLRDAVEQVTNGQYDVGCVGIYTIVNYGAHLTYYALYRVLRHLGYSVTMVTPPLDTWGRAQDRPPLFAVSPYPEWVQLKRFVNMAEMKKLNRICHTFVSGSDQMWNNQLWREFTGFMALPFVTDDHPKIAYAASAGHDHIWGMDGDRATQAHFLAKFDAVSVREDSAVDLFRREFGVQDAKQVLDPVFLMPSEDYEELIANSPVSPQDSQPYLFSYVLEPSREKEKSLRRCIKKLGLKNIIAMTDSDETTAEDRISAWDIDTLTGEHLESWISCIWHSSFVVADSFHGTCLAILFHKPFVAFVNKDRGETRFTSLLTTFNLMDRLIYSFDDIDRVLALPPIDWDAVDGILATEKEQSLGWLRKALEDGRNTTKRAASTYDVLDARVDELWLHADKGYYESANRLQDANRRLQEMKRFLDENLSRSV